MKKIGFFITLFLLVLVAWRPSNNAAEIAQAQGVIEAARAAQDAARAAQIASQGLSDVGRGQTLMLVLLTLMLLILVSFAVYIFIHRLTYRMNTARQTGFGNWISGPNAHWKHLQEPDLYQQMLLQQEWLLSQLLSQGHAENPDDDSPQLPTDWWE